MPHDLLNANQPVTFVQIIIAVTGVRLMDMEGCPLTLTDSSLKECLQYTTACKSRPTAFG